MHSNAFIDHVRQIFVFLSLIPTTSLFHVVEKIIPLVNWLVLFFSYQNSQQP